MTKDDARRMVWELIWEQLSEIVDEEIGCWNGGARRGIYPGSPSDEDVEKLRSAVKQLEREAIRRIGPGSFARLKSKTGGDG